MYKKRTKLKTVEFKIKITFINSSFNIANNNFFFNFIYEKAEHIQKSYNHQRLL